MKINICFIVCNKRDYLLLDASIESEPGNEPPPKVYPVVSSDSGLLPQKIRSKIVAIGSINGLHPMNSNHILDHMYRREDEASIF